MVEITNLSDVLAQIRQRESRGDYSLTPQQNYAYPRSHASGAYQFQPDTWRTWAARSGIGGQYPEAYQAPPEIQDAVARFAATNGPGVNSPVLWGASSQGGNYPTPVPGTAVPTPPGGDLNAYVAQLQNNMQNQPAAPAPGPPLPIGGFNPEIAALRRVSAAFSPGQQQQQAQQASLSLPLNSPLLPPMVGDFTSRLQTMRPAVDTADPRMVVSPYADPGNAMPNPSYGLQAPAQTPVDRTLPASLPEDERQRRLRQQRAFRAT
jgi:hypothetical protein